MESSVLRCTSSGSARLSWRGSESGHAFRLAEASLCWSMRFLENSMSRAWNRIPGITTMVALSMWLAVGCGSSPNAGQPPTGQSGGGGSADSPGSLTDPLRNLCGTRKVTSIPGPGHVVESTTGDITVEPPSSDFAKTLGVLATFLPKAQPTAPAEEEYEVATDGEILGTGTRFVVQNGCLTTRTDENDNENPEDDPSPQEPSRPDPGPCGGGGFPIGHAGVDDTSDGYICVAVWSNVCLDCQETGTAWTFEAKVEITYEALGSIGGVLVFDPASTGFTNVDIHVGDRFTITFESKSETKWEAPP